MSDTISYVFYHHYLRRFKWLARVSDDRLSHNIATFLHQNYMLNTVHCAAALAIRTRTSFIRTCVAPPPTHPVTINLYHFKGSVAH